MDELLEASNRLEYRTVECRLLGSAHRPLKPVMRANAADGDGLGEEWLLVRTVSASARNTDTAVAAQRVRGVGALLIGRYDAAVSELRDAATRDTPADDFVSAIAKTDNVSLLVELTAAYAARARKVGSLKDAMTAAECAERAWSLRQTAETGWNRALAREMIGIGDEALEAWRQYLALDAKSAWAAEARAHVRRLSATREQLVGEALANELRKAATAGNASRVRELVRLHPRDARTFVEDELLPLAATDATRRHALCDAATLIAQSFHAQRSSSVTLSVRATCAGARTHHRQQDLAEGYLAYRRGRELYRADKIAEAAAFFTTSAEHLREVDPAGGLLATLQLAYCAYSGGDMVAAERTVTRVTAQLHGLSLEKSALAAYAEWMAGLIELARGKPHSAISKYEHSLGLFSALGEVENVLALHNLLAEGYALAGDDEAADQHRLKALMLLGEAGGSPRLHVTIGEAAETALRYGLPRVALSYQNVLVERASRDANPRELADSLSSRAAIHAEAGLTAGAAADLERARSIVRSVSDESLRNIAQMDLGLRAASIAPARQDPAAIGGVVAYWESQRHVLRAASARVSLADVYRARGDHRRAETEYAAALAQMEAAGLGVDEEQKLSLVRDRYYVCNRLIDAALRRGDAMAALEYADRAKLGRLAALLLPDAERRIATPRTSIRTIQSRLRDGQLVLAYSIHADQLLAWSMSRRNVRLIRRRIRLAEIESAVIRFSDALRNAAKPAAKPDPAGAALYRMLFGGFEAELAGVELLLVAADGPLRAVALSALRNPQTGRYLIRDMAIAVTPALAMLRVDDGGVRADDDVALIVAADRAGTSDLPLPGAARESQLIRRVYPRHTLLARDDATKGQVVRALAEVAVFHFAGHGVLNEQLPRFSALRLAGDGSDSNLYLHEIARYPLGQLRVAVLSACKSGSSRTRHSYGRLALSDAFLVAGAANVVGAMVDVSDEATRVVVAFHEYFTQGDAPAVALRRAQLRCIDTCDVREWAQFQLFTGRMP